MGRWPRYLRQTQDIAICEVTLSSQHDIPAWRYSLSLTQRDTINSFLFFWLRQRFSRVATPHFCRAFESSFPKRNLKIDHGHSDTGSKPQQLIYAIKVCYLSNSRPLCQISVRRSSGFALARAEKAAQHQSWVGWFAFMNIQSLSGQKRVAHASTNLWFWDIYVLRVAEHDIYMQEQRA